jgi:ORF6N domain-containing protein
LKRNLERFPDDFMFRLTNGKWANLMQEGIRSQNVTASQKKRNIGITPYAFTEHGVTMLASILKSEKAIEMNIAIVRAFIALRQFALHYKELADQVQEIG